MRPRLAPRRGYSLVELMAVVAIIGILAVLAVYGYRRWLQWARLADGKDMVLTIASGQEDYYQQTEGYLSCSSSVTDYYPMAPTQGKHLFHDSNHPDYPCWRLIQSDGDAATYQSFVTIAGNPGEGFPGLPTDKQMTLSAPADEPWYIVMAVADQDLDGVRAYMVTSSLQPSEVVVENETE